MPARHGAVHVATTRRIDKDRVDGTHLLRRSYREDGKVKHETLGNLSHLPVALIDVIRRRLQSKQPEVAGDVEILRSLPHGHNETCTSSLNSEWQLGPSEDRELYQALDWLLQRQG
jgi:hypothetical protein